MVNAKGVLIISLHAAGQQGQGAASIAKRAMSGVTAKSLGRSEILVQSAVNSYVTWVAGQGITSKPTRSYVLGSVRVASILIHHALLRPLILRFAPRGIQYALAVAIGKEVNIRKRIDFAPIALPSA